MDHRFWALVAKRLADVATVLVFDCRGHGESDKPPGPYTPDLFASDLAAILDEAGWRSAVIAGASMGVCVSLAFAGRRPERCRALGLFDTTAWYGPNAPTQWSERAEKALRGGLGGLVEFQQTRWFGDQFRADHSETVQECVSVFLSNSTAAYADSCRMLGDTDLRAVLPTIDVPTSVLVGSEDATPLQMAQALHAGIRASTLTVVEGARHLTPLECPDRITAELNRLIKASSL